MFFAESFVDRNGDVVSLHPCSRRITRRETRRWTADSKTPTSRERIAHEKGGESHPSEGVAQKRGRDKSLLTLQRHSIPAKVLIVTDIQVMTLHILAQLLLTSRLTHSCSSLLPQAAIKIVKRIKIIDCFIVTNSIYFFQQRIKTN